MGNGQTCLVLLCAFAASACIGGQSGTEGQPDLPSTCDELRPVGRDDATPLGTASAFIESVSSPQAASLRWFRGASSYTDTTLTLTVVVPPQAATYRGSTGSDCSPVLEIPHSTLLFQTADGAFNEAFTGTVSVSAAGREFECSLPVNGQFSGSYDIAAAAAALQNPMLLLQTTLTPATGSMYLTSDSSAGLAGASLTIADWTGVQDGGP